MNKIIKFYLLFTVSLLFTIVLSCVTEQPLPVPSPTLPQVTPSPTVIPTEIPTPTIAPTAKPTIAPTAIPTPVVTAVPTPVVYNFPPTPNEDAKIGKNDNAYLALRSATRVEKNEFIAKYSKDVQAIAKAGGLPPSAILAMMALESGFGFTRTGLYANNFFGAKSWGGKWKSVYCSGVYQLKGQPDENGGSVKILQILPSGQLIFDESNRPDNLYFKCDTPQDSVKLLVNEWIVQGKFSKKYIGINLTYQANIKKMSKLDASKQFLFDLGQLGYCHLGGEYYRKTVGPIIDYYGLDSLD